MNQQMIDNEAKRVAILGPELAGRVRGMNMVQIGEMVAFIDDDLGRLKALMKAVDSGELYLPGLGPSLTLSPGWRN